MKKPQILVQQEIFLDKFLGPFFGKGLFSAVPTAFLMNDIPAQLFPISDNGFKSVRRDVESL